MNSATNISVETKKPRRVVRWGRRLLVIGAVFASLVLAGFVFFSTKLVNGGHMADLRNADAIVVLTGGEARIPEAIKLLHKGKGERLLISGVNPLITKKELASLAPNSKRLFTCCIDVDQARDTIGNADETRLWVKKRGFQSLIVVTASYHMPRSLAELRRALPDTELIPYPVQPRNLHVEAWWAYKGTLKLLAMEYLKFMPAFGRCVFIQIGRNRGVYHGARDCLNAPASG